MTIAQSVEFGICSTFRLKDGSLASTTHKRTRAQKYSDERDEEDDEDDDRKRLRTERDERSGNGANSDTEEGHVSISTGNLGSLFGRSAPKPGGNSSFPG